MAFLESRIDPNITRESSFIVEHPARLKLYNAEGVLDGQVFADTPPKHRVNLAHNIRTEAQFHALRDAFYVVMFTPYEGLRVKNWSDYQANASNSAVSSLGAGVYQLRRKHTFGGISFYRDITKPVNDGTLKVYNASNSELTPTVNYNTGTFTVASGTPAYWTGTFDTPMTFQSDTWDAQIETLSGGGIFIPLPIWMEEVPGV